MKKINAILFVAVVGFLSLSASPAYACACGPEPIPSPKIVSGGGFAFAQFGNGAQFSWDNYVAPVISIGSNGTTTTVATTAGYFKNSGTNGKFVFNHDMTLGATRTPDLGELQKVLIAEKFLQATDAKNVFDAKMRDAVANFQKAHGIRPAPQYPYGYFGPLTRGYLNSVKV